MAKKHGAELCGRHDMYVSIKRLACRSCLYCIMGVLGLLGVCGCSSTVDNGVGHDERRPCGSEADVTDLVNVKSGRLEMKGQDGSQEDTPDASVRPMTIRVRPVTVEVEWEAYSVTRKHVEDSSEIASSLRGWDSLGVQEKQRATAAVQAYMANAAKAAIAKGVNAQWIGENRDSLLLMFAEKSGTGNSKQQE